MESKRPIIAVQKLNVTYFPGRSNEVCAPKDISLDIYQGEYIIFFGPSGCGKSTLLYSLAGLERNVTGAITVKGKNISAMNQRELEEYHQTTIGMIFQSYYLISSLNVAQNVALPQVAIGGGKAERMKKAEDLLTKFGVGAQAKKLPTELSGGQQQRVAICRALVNDPDILVADEPVGNLDSKSTKDVMELLRYLNDVQKKTVILVTHDPSHLYHAHRIFYVRDGMITNTKTNTAEERKQPTVSEGSGGVALASALTHWVRTLAPRKGAKQAAAPVAIGKQTQEILAETLTGMTVEEIVTIERRLSSLLEKGHQGRKTIYGFLCTPVDRGGVGMDKHKARRLAEEMEALARKIHGVEKAARRRSGAETATTVARDFEHIRALCIEHCGLHLKERAITGLDTTIGRCLAGELDRVHTQRILSRSVHRGGVGLAPRQARKVSQLLEMFISEALPSPPPHA